MKLIGKITLYVLIFAVAVMLCGCSASIDEPHVFPCFVVVVDSADFHIANNDTRKFYADNDGNVTIELVMKNNMYVRGVDYGNYDIDYGGKGRAKLILHDVKYTFRLNVECEQLIGSHMYFANGGTIAYTDKEYLTVPFDTKHHIRVNTHNGIGFERDGHTLTGWNTLPDGSGAHIGLGSRIGVDNGESLNLYAEWSKWSDARDFGYADVGGGVAITGYFGTDDVITVPERIDGKPVTEIAGAAFVNAAAHTVVLPVSLKTVRDRAFIDCGLKELYIFDSLTVIDDKSFIGCNSFRNLHINAAVPPRYTDFDRHSNLADKYDILIENKDKKKIVIFGGSGSYFSVDTKQIEKRFPEYVAINMAVNAFFSGAAQMEMILPYLRADDIFLHIPEAASEYQFMANTSMSDVRLFGALESNYDLFANVDIRNVDDVFSSFKKYQKERFLRPEKTYSDYADYIDDRGNYKNYRREHGTDESISQEAALKFDLLSEANAARLFGYYERISDLGAKPLVSNAAVNFDGLLKRYYDEGLAYESQVRELIASYEKAFYGFFKDYPVLVGFSDCVYRGRVFYNSDYHLSSVATVGNTEKIIDGLAKYV